MRLPNLNQTSNGRFLHKDRGEREPFKSEYWAGKRQKFVLVNVLVILSLNVLVLLNLSNFFGSTYYIDRNTHHLHILSLDYDGGPVGKALQLAYEQFKGDNFPTLIPGNPNDYDITTLTKEVCQNRHIWGLIYTHPGASERLSDALSSDEAAASYDSQDAITFIWNGIRYTTLAQGLIEGNLQQLISAANVAYALINGTYDYTHINTSSKTSLQVIAGPFSPSSSVNIQPTPQGARVLYNTVVVVITIVTEFFYVMSVNGVAKSFQMFTKLGLVRNLKIRWTTSLVYSAALGASLTGVIWSFRGPWKVTAAQGVETWLTLLWTCQIHFFVFDTITGWVDAPWIAFIVLTWILVNITSTIVPLELTPGFYHWEYAIPSFEIYQLLITIWSRGCNPQNFRAIPILFSWWILGFFGSWLSMIQKCNTATKLNETIGTFQEDLAKAQTENDVNDSNSQSLRLKRQESLAQLLHDSSPLWLNMRAPFENRLGLRQVQTHPGTLTDPEKL